ncbi:N-acetyl-gamma-glutamyl-phosphate reductase [Halomonas sabkhae]|uniref:N-acetyl-gamma-glutamyl-phosphate reductase n=1 Tax=Halomonas sabkhae TaxID=626223 RepID=UPI0025B28E2A|nr:N-acetyl-gamma-glutamyl-phosphate reductase [Halomonas sabkhae]MDN3525273.1 N-acetyl-gamma-glutamyl-phosphate reductase [Halomonas sabkhae]
MVKKIYIDGYHGTAGLEIDDLLSPRNDLEVLKLSKSTRSSSIEERIELMKGSDATILCLPNVASKEIMSKVKNDDDLNDKPLIDTSSQFRLDSGWTYGLPELSETARKEIAESKRVANVGCHASAFILAIKPLIDAEFIRKQCIVTAASQTGYSGGGKEMIEKYEALNSKNCSEGIGVELYNLQSNHKHLEEMRLRSGLEKSPIFMPAVGNYYRGLCLSVGFHRSQIVPKCSIHDKCFEILKSHYSNSSLVKVNNSFSENSLRAERLSANLNARRNFADIFVSGSSDTVQVTLAMDNLRKGAATTAVQNLNLMLGISEYRGLL